jgi:hypothetical protein
MKNTTFCIIDKTLYPEFKIFLKYKYIINSEILLSIKEPRWTYNNIYKQLVNSNFILSNNKTRFLIENNYQKLDKKKTIQQYFLVIKNIILKENIRIIPNIMRAINSVPNVYNASIICIKSDTKSNILYNSFNNKINTCLIPIITRGNCGIIINNNFTKWNNHDFIILNNKCPYIFINNTHLDNYIIAIDFISTY